MKSFFALVASFWIVLTFNSCTTGVEKSPEPGILRVTLKSNDADSILIILGDTIRTSRVDKYDVIVSKGRLYRGNNYVELFAAPTIERITADTVNILQRQWFNGRWVDDTDPFEIPNGQTKHVRYTVLEWHTPPGDYDKLEFGLTGIEVFVAIPRQFRNPLQLSDGVSPIMGFPKKISVNEGRVTQIDFEIDPFRSIKRNKDLYLFDRKIQIVGVQNF